MCQNCWEFKKCGRQPGGVKVSELGVCPASTCSDLDGIHDGKNSGRCCWVVTGTYCKGEVQGTFAKKMKNCLECDFYKIVQKEQGFNFKSSLMIMNELNKK